MATTQSTDNLRQVVELDFSRCGDERSRSTAYIVEIPKLRSQLHDLAADNKGSLVAISLKLTGNNLRIRRGGEQLATMLVSMFHRLALHGSASPLAQETTTTPHEDSPTVLPVLLEAIDVSSTGAMEDHVAWAKVFRTIAQLPAVPLRRFTANDESLQVGACSPLLEALASSCTHLTHISLRRCLLTSVAMEAFAQGIRGSSCSALEFLDVSENELDSNALVALAGALHDSEPHRRQLRVLKMSHNAVGSSNTTNGSSNNTTVYCRKGLLSLALLILHAPLLAEVSLAHNQLGAAYGPRWPAGGDHGGVSEVSEAARRSIATRGGGHPPILDVSNNSFNAATSESLHRCSGFTAVVNS